MQQEHLDKLAELNNSTNAEIRALAHIVAQLATPAPDAQPQPQPQPEAPASGVMPPSDE